MRDFEVNFQPHVYVLGKSALENFSRIEGRYTSINSHNPGDLLDRATADGKEHLLIEAGGKVAGAFLKANLVNRIIWMSAPIVLGDGVSAVQGLGVSTLKDALKGQIAEQFVLGGDTITVLRMNRCSH
ncbi:MAG: RibD family protein [Candidatus Nanopelagicales bacterium]